MTWENNYLNPMVRGFKVLDLSVGGKKRQLMFITSDLLRALCRNGYTWREATRKELAALKHHL